MFYSAISALDEEAEHRKKVTENRISFGNKFLDDALMGIDRNDLILVGSRSGAGKTQFCCNVALSAIAKNKRVHFFALEADNYEIERRVLFQLFSRNYFEDRKFAFTQINISYRKWYEGKYLDEENINYQHEIAARKLAKATLENLFLYYKQDTFGAEDLTSNILNIHKETDLIIIDHAHYFDFEDDNENKAIKKIAQTARSLALDLNKPIILVAHLRKSDRYSNELAPGLEEFHGSSDLYKIATKVVTFAPGGVTSDGRYQTFFRTPKCRIDGGVVKYLAQLIFDPKTGRYNDEYELGWANQLKNDKGEPSVLKKLEPDNYPEWCPRKG